MPSEGRRGGELGFPNSHLVDGLDEVARGLAAGTISRGRAIKLGGAALLGSMGLFTLFEGRARAHEVTVQAGSCKHKPALSNKLCGTHSCGVCDSCSCARAVGGRKRCVDITPLVAGGCPGSDQCERNSDCPGNEYCIQVGACCGGPRNFCLPRCPKNPDNCP
jgi:hypothetical protein